MKIYIDPDECTGHGRCYRLAPDLLTYDDPKSQTRIEIPFTIPWAKGE